MAVFPENMDKLDANDPHSSFGIIENYIRYMGERIEFSMRNMTKTVSAAGVSSAEMYILLTALQNDFSALKSTINGLSGNITSLGGQVSSLQSSLTALEGKVAAVEGGISTLQASVEGLEQRVTALEST